MNAEALELYRKKLEHEKEDLEATRSLLFALMASGPNTAQPAEEKYNGNTNRNHRSGS